MFCSKCGKETSAEAEFCAHCGAPTKAAPDKAVQVQAPLTQRYEGPDVSEKLMLPAVLLCWFLGMLGVHRFYVGKIGTGILWLFTGGLLGIGIIYDLIMIVIGSFTDSEGKKLKNWT